MAGLRGGTDPTNPNDFLRAVISLTNDVPYVSWTPNLNTNGEVRVYTVMGKTNLTTIDLPDTIAEIGKRAFKDCVNLANMK